MRGTRVRKFGVDCGNGIIPAYAGNTESDRYPFARSGDHPRVCGEHLLVVCVFANCWGSSPRMRGTQGHSRVFPAVRGIIPAYAGNTRLALTVLPVRWDHPRVCGEHPRAPITKFHGAGSSPRMRGTLVKRIVKRVRRGIIPAYAGNTRWTFTGFSRSGDHPRVCGEHVILGGDADVDRGSSPRMRGTH